MSVIHAIEQQFKKPHVVDVKSGDTVRVHQKIREGSKERIQVFEGLVIRTKRKNSHNAAITVRRIASGVGVEKTYLLHSPLVVKVEVKKRSKVRRNYLSYMRERTGKSARLTSVEFDRESVNAVPQVKEKAEKPTEEAPVEKKASEAQSSTSAKVDSAAEESKPEAKSEQKPAEKQESKTEQKEAKS